MVKKRKRVSNQEYLYKKNIEVMKPIIPTITEDFFKTLSKHQKNIVIQLDNVIHQYNQPINENKYIKFSSRNKMTRKIIYSLLDYYDIEHVTKNDEMYFEGQIEWHSITCQDCGGLYRVYRSLTPKMIKKSIYIQLPFNINNNKQKINNLLNNQENIKRNLIKYELKNGLMDKALKKLKTKIHYEIDKNYKGMEIEDEEFIAKAILGPRLTEKEQFEIWG